MDVLGDVEHDADGGVSEAADVPRLNVLAALAGRAEPPGVDARRVEVLPSEHELAAAGERVFPRARVLLPELLLVHAFALRREPRLVAIGPSQRADEAGVGAR